MYNRQNVYVAYVKFGKIYPSSLDQLFLLNYSCNPTVLWEVRSNNIFYDLDDSIIYKNFGHIIQKQKDILSDKNSTITFSKSNTNIIDYINGLL